MSLKKLLLSSDDGFTFIEVLAAITIFSFSAFIIWGGLSGGLRTVDKIYEKSRITMELSLFEYLFRKSVNDIQIPYWEKETDTSGFRVYQENEVLYIETEGFKHQFKYVKLDKYVNTDDGFELTLITVSGSQVTLFENYGSYPLQGDT